MRVVPSWSVREQLGCGLSAAAYRVIGQADGAAVASQGCRRAHSVVRAVRYALVAVLWELLTERVTFGDEIGIARIRAGTASFRLADRDAATCS
ncbi:hypothetical protein [Nocardia brasiliensis]|uniref:hypothetical protein n=1 Tax=Nocardia brasiliensis TaxID=37326 RepID=UPI0024586548|nr:hypothetical protein [Nocardia brasiliensis]